MRRFFVLPPDRGLSPELLGSSLQSPLPCSDDLLGRGVPDAGIDDFGFNSNAFFGIGAPVSVEGSTAGACSSVVPSRPQPDPSEEQAINGGDCVENKHRVSK